MDGAMEGTLSLASHHTRAHTHTRCLLLQKLGELLESLAPSVHHLSGTCTTVAELCAQDALADELRPAASTPASVPRDMILVPPGRPVIKQMASWRLTEEERAEMDDAVKGWPNVEKAPRISFSAARATRLVIGPMLDCAISGWLMIE